MSGRRPVLVVTGLRREGRIAAGPGVTVVLSGGDRAALNGRLAALAPSRFAAIVSFGLAGALDPKLRVGTPVIGLGVSDGAVVHPASRDIAAAWASRLSAGDEIYRESALAGVDAPVLDVAQKAALRAQTGADAVDMESHVAAAYATRCGLPFGILRFISDPAELSLPPVTGRAMRPDGSIALGVLFDGLARDPRQIPGLIRAGRDAAIAFRALRRVRRLLGPGLGLDL